MLAMWLTTAPLSLIMWWRPDQDRGPLRWVLQAHLSTFYKVFVPAQVYSFGTPSLTLPACLDIGTYVHTIYTAWEKFTSRHIYMRENMYTLVVENLLLCLLTTVYVLYICA